MASRTAQALDELAKLRQRWVSDTDGIATAITASLASLQYKMEWVHHEPFTIWQARRVGSTHCSINACSVVCNLGLIATRCPRQARSGVIGRLQH